MKRKVTIIETKNQSTKVFESEATTLGALKAQARALGIDDTDMGWYEGHLKAELMDDSSPLPENIPWKGGTTNELAFMLTNGNKHIKSGADRVSLYRKIKEYGLEGKCKELYGKNFTTCTSVQLQELVDSCCCSKCGKTDDKKKDTGEEYFKNTLDSLYFADKISRASYFEVKDAFESGNKPEEPSQDEIDEMFGFIK